MFHFQNGGCLAFMFSSFLMTLFLLPAERCNKIRVKKGKFFDECVSSVSADVSVVCRPTRQWDRILYLYPFHLVMFSCQSIPLFSWIIKS